MTAFTDIKAFNNYARSGGVMYILESTDLSFGSCTFSNNQASEKGGTIYISRVASSKVSWYYISLINSEISGSSSVDSGGAIYM
jgi:predicted outer membrane repeat protein